MVPVAQTFVCGRTNTMGRIPIGVPDEDRGPTTIPPCHPAAGPRARDGGQAAVGEDGVDGVRSIAAAPRRPHDHLAVRQRPLQQDAEVRAPAGRGGHWPLPPSSTLPPNNFVPGKYLNIKYLRWCGGCKLK